MSTRPSVTGLSAGTRVGTTPTVDALDLATSLGSGTVRSAQFDTTLRRTQSVAGNRLRVDVENMGPADAVRVQVERLPRRIYVYNNINASTASYCDMNIDQEANIADAHANLKALTAPNASTCRFNLSKMLVIYTEGGVEYMRDLQALVESDEQIRKAYGELAKQVMPVWGTKFRSTTLEAERKTSSTHPVPLQRHNDIYKGLPVTYSQSAKMALQLYAGSGATQVQQDAALHRIIAAEKIMHSHVKKLKELKTECDASGTPQARKDLLTSQIRELEKLDVDRFAVYYAAAFYPADMDPTLSVSEKIREISAAAKKAKEALEQLTEKWRTDYNTKNHTMLNRVKSALPKFMGGKDLPEFVKESNTFSQDAAALMFSTLPPAEARMGYLDFCREHGFYPKTDCAEDSIMRFMGGVLSTPAATNGFQVLDNAIGGIADPALQGQCRAALNDFDTPQLKALIGQVADPAVKADCLKALKKLDIDYIRPIERLSDPTIRAACRANLKDALTQAHAIVHGPLAPMPPPTVGATHSLDDKIAHYKTVHHFD